MYTACDRLQPVDAVNQGQDSNQNPYRHSLDSTFDAELLFGARLTTDTRALVSAGEAPSTPQITRQPATWRSTWQMAWSLQHVKCIKRREGNC